MLARYEVSTITRFCSLMLDDLVKLNIAFKTTDLMRQVVRNFAMASDKK